MVFSMLVTQEAFGRLGQIPNLQVSEGAPLARYAFHMPGVFTLIL